MDIYVYIEHELLESRECVNSLKPIKLLNIQRPFMRWIKLYGNALLDERLLALTERLSYEGLGIYYAVLMQVECVGEGSMQLEQIIASFRRRVKRKNILSVIFDFQLFMVNDFNIVSVQRPIPGYPLADAGAQTGADTCETPAGTEREELEKSSHYDHHPSINSGQVHFLKPVLRFQKPTIEELTAYCQEKGYHIDVERFYDFNETRGWMIGKTLMKSWKGALATWVRKEKSFHENQNENPSLITNHSSLIEGFIPDDAPPRPSPRAQWDFATNSWNEFY